LNDRNVSASNGASAPKGVVLCVGTSYEQCAAVARSVGPTADVLIAPDARSALSLLQGRGGDRDAPTGIRHGPLAIDETEREVLWDGEPIPLCAREFDLLTTLARDWGRVWSFADLTEAVWKRRYIGDSDAVISAVKRLRRRLATVTQELSIASVRGVGFRVATRRLEASGGTNGSAAVGAARAVAEATRTAAPGSATVPSDSAPDSAPDEPGPVPPGTADAPLRKVG